MQAPQAPASIRHSKVEPTSSDVKPNEAALEPVGFVGLELIVVWGAARSIVKVRLIGVSTFASASVPRTRIV